MIRFESTLNNIKIKEPKLLRKNILTKIAELVRKGIKDNLRSGKYYTGKQSKPYGDLYKEVVKQIQDREAVIFMSAQSEQKAKWIQFGTEPHEIEAKGRALAWENNGETIFAKHVNHPGIKQMGFFRIEQQALNDIENLFQTTPLEKLFEM